MPETDETLDGVDLLVLGGGMAGLTAGARAAYAGGIASALVFGVTAARTATRQVLES